MTQPVWRSRPPASRLVCEAQSLERCKDQRTRRRAYVNGDDGRGWDGDGYGWWWRALQVEAD